MKALFENKTVSVCGIGISNLPLIDFLLRHGAEIIARDIKEREKLTVADELERKGVKVICGENYLAGIKEDYIFRAPGIRFDNPDFVKAVERGSILTSEMELFFSLCKAKIIGITGSDGKTTTTTLIYNMLKESGKRVFLGGNIGKPLLPDVEEMTENDFAVVELSSFQLHTMKHSPDIAVITNLSPNHLNYHIDMNEYIEAKCNIYRHMKAGGRLILNFNNAPTRALASDAPDGVKVCFFGDENGICDKNDIITVGRDFTGKAEKETVMLRSDILLPGHHNVENYMAAIGALYGIVPFDVIKKIANTFPGVEHRLELCGEKNGVRFVNSSIDSSPTRTIAALGALEPWHGKINVILGGYDKNIAFTPLAEPLCRAAKNIILTGATRDKIKAEIEKYQAENKLTAPEIFVCDDFEAAVIRASSLAESGDTVLLSPACASFDAFPNFEIRGKKFKEIVENITK